MRVQWLETVKPAAPASVHLLLAWLMWAIVGSGLFAVGCWWLWKSHNPYALWLALMALAIGFIKSRLVLDRAAARIVARVQEHGDGRCLGGFLSVRSWLFVAVMMGTGRLLRASHLARDVLGVFYMAIGMALLLSSSVARQAWYQSRRKNSP